MYESQKKRISQCELKSSYEIKVNVWDIETCFLTKYLFIHMNYLEMSLNLTAVLKNIKLNK